MNKSIALITGANKGIGYETAYQLGKAGITILASARSKEKGTAATTQLKAAGIDAEFLQLNVDSTAEITSAVDFIEKKYGRLDILVNNAGIMLEVGGWDVNTAPTIDEQVLRATLDTNFFGVVKLTNALLPLLRKSDAGRIVNLSSILGSLTLHSNPSSPIYQSKLFAYNMSKTALNAYTVHLAAALANTNIKVNAAHPGWVKTDMGTDEAPMEIVDGAKTSVQLALLGADGPTGAYIHMGDTLPW